MSGRMDHYASCPLPVLSASREVIRDFLPGLSTQLSEEVVREIRSLLPQDPRAYFADDTRDHARLLLDVYLAQTGDPAPLSVLWPDASAEPTPGEIGHMIQALWRGSHVRHSMAMAQWGLERIESHLFRPGRPYSDELPNELLLAFLLAHRHDGDVRRFIHGLLTVQPGRMYPYLDRLISALAWEPDLPGALQTTDPDFLLDLAHRYDSCLKAALDAYASHLTTDREE